MKKHLVPHALKILKMENMGAGSICNGLGVKTISLVLHSGSGEWSLLVIDKQKELNQANSALDLNEK